MCESLLGVEGLNRHVFKSFNSLLAYEEMHKVSCWCFSLFHLTRPGW